jgi:cytochrome P450
VDESLEFDPYHPDYLKDPYPTLARFRTGRPIFYDENWRLTFFTKYEHIKSILKDRQKFGRDFRHQLSVDDVDAGLVDRIFPSDAPLWVKYVRESFMDHEPPRHTRFRNLVSQAFAILTLNAGHEATVLALGNALLALANHPDQYKLLVEKPDLVPNAVDELLRFDTPLQLFDRWILEDCEVDGNRLKKGQKVGLLLGSANHDETAFEGNTEILDLTRDSANHIAFGAGLHHCVGAPLAKLELETALSVLVSKARSIAIDGPIPERKRSLVFRGLSKLSLRLDPKE